jgi:hypothetical protein
MNFPPLPSLADLCAQQPGWLDAAVDELDSS